MLHRWQIANVASWSSFCGQARTSLALLCLILSGIVGTASTEANAMEIVVSWASIEHGIRTRVSVWRSKRSVRLNLAGGNVIAEARSVTSELSGRTNRLDTAGRFRDELNASRTVQSSWRVQDARTLIRTETRPQHTETIRITVDSQNRCRATISYRLIPGFREYRMTSISTGRPVYLSALSAEHVICTIKPD
jgi:hypothetical protein